MGGVWTGWTAQGRGVKLRTIRHFCPANPLLCIPISKTSSTVRCSFHSYLSPHKNKINRNNNKIFHYKNFFFFFSSFDDPDSISGQNRNTAHFFTPQEAAIGWWGNFFHFRADYTRMAHLITSFDSENRFDFFIIIIFYIYFKVRAIKKKSNFNEILIGISSAILSETSYWATQWTLERHIGSKSEPHFLAIVTLPVTRIGDQTTTSQDRSWH